MGILLFELFRNPLFMGILNKWETLVKLLDNVINKWIEAARANVGVAFIPSLQG